MFRFPFGTTQELNLDWFLEQWEVFKQEAQTALDGIDHALDDEIQRVEDAMTDLYAARDAAIAAKNNALDYAQSANSSAIGASQSAQNSAASAVTSAQQAQSAATSATAAGNSATAAGNSATAAGNSAAAAQGSAQSAGTSAGNALAQAQNSEAWAIGSIGGVPVPPTADQYENNAKYYAESISGDAAAAAQSASDAAASAASVGASAAQITENTANIADIQSDISPTGDGTNLFNKNTASLGRGYNVNTNSTSTDNTLARSSPISVKAGDTLIVNKSMRTNTYGFNFLNQAETQLIAAAYCDGFHRRVKIPEGAEKTYWTVEQSVIDDFTMEIVPQVKAMAEDIANEANSFYRKTLKDQLYQDNGFWHCAFPSIALFAGKEVVAYRASQSHLTPADPANWGGVILKTRTPDGVWNDLGLLDTSDYSFNGELRDPCLTVSRDGKTLFMSCFTTYRDASDPNVDLHDNVLFTLDTDLQITSCNIIRNASNTFFGNTLVTPNGYLLHAAYNPGTVYLYRSATPFTNSVSEMAWSEPLVLSTTYSATECTIGYWDDLLVLIFRRDDNNWSRYNFTTNLEGTDGWKAASSLTPILNGFTLHAPVLLPYWSGKYLPVAGAKYDSSTDRYAIAALIEKDSENIFTFKCWGNVDTDQFGYSGYCGLAYFGGDEFSIPYYRESGKGYSTLNASTGVYYKHFHMRTLCPEMAYM